MAPLAPSAWLETPGAASGRPEVDRYMLLQAIKLRRDLARQEKPCGVIWSIGRQTLCDVTVWGEITQVLKANRALGASIICEVRLGDYADLRQAELDALFAIREAGFQLGLRECASLRDLTKAAKTGVFRFVSAEPGVIAGAADIPDLRSRDITFIGTGIDNEEDAIGLIDRDIRLAQGPLFAPAKPLRRSTGAAQAPDGAA
jgi:EAL domain-containing protein (putative c-di-GMP-specific phosphodiesterase class I)